MLSVGAVIGREFDVAVAGSALGISGLPLIDAADDALLSGMVVETAPGRLGFSHALLHDAVGERLSQMRRASVHRADCTGLGGNRLIPRAASAGAGASLGGCRRGGPHGERRRGDVGGSSGRPGSGRGGSRRGDRPL